MTNDIELIKQSIKDTLVAIKYVESQAKQALADADIVRFGNLKLDLIALDRIMVRLGEDLVNKMDKAA